eukprot:Sspe_Gene.91521::Locus_63023_Transcript_1_1_Confidence_1.000_Length_1198::g.91521::m.91521
MGSGVSRKSAEDKYIQNSYIEYESDNLCHPFHKERPVLTQIEPLKWRWTIPSPPTSFPAKIYSEPAFDNGFAFRCVLSFMSHHSCTFDIIPCGSEPVPHFFAAATVVNEASSYLNANIVCTYHTPGRGAEEFEWYYRGLSKKGLNRVRQSSTWTYRRRSSVMGLPAVSSLYKQRSRRHSRPKRPSNTTTLVSRVSSTSFGLSDADAPSGTVIFTFEFDVSDDSFCEAEDSSTSSFLQNLSSNRNVFRSLAS